MLILGMIAFGVLIGWVARTILGRSDLSWGRTILFGILGSFVGGLIVSLISGDGLALRPSGIIGSIVGAILLILGDQMISRRSKTSKS
ncbi:MAG TPA: GlsB/YeaQ/YmgE family stress response membrane protein [Acidimicrobiales bacterium]